MSPLKGGVALAALAVLAAGWSCWNSVDGDASAQMIQLDFDSGRLFFGAEEYQIEMDEERSYAGLVRYAGENEDPNIPYMTHEFIVTTGEYSDPEFVKIGRVRNHSTRWEARVMPEGTLNFAHCIPSSPEVYELLEQVDEGDQVELWGHPASQGVKDEKGRLLWQTMSADHPVLVVTDVVWSEG